MNFLNEICVLSLIFNLSTASLNVCLLTSESIVNSNIISEICESPQTTLLQDDGSHYYHFIEKRDIASQNLIENTSNHTIASDEDKLIESSTKNKVQTESTTTTAQISTQPETLSTTTLKPSSTTQEIKAEYDPDSGDNSIDVDDLNTTLTTIDHHRYYKSFLKQGNEEIKDYWVDFESLGKDVIVNEMLSSSYRRALSVHLTFRFPFYGHILDNVTIATGGFLFTGDFLHKWLAATQYIAPLMANFDTSSSKNAMVKYIDNGTSLTVQWENVLLQDNKDIGPFTFQVTINSSGHIIFAYKDIPITISYIGDSKHPVKVGLSDAYIVEKTIFYMRKKTIYEYHKIDMKTGFYISNQTAIVFQPLPNCVQFHSCEACLTKVTSFKCEWCQQVGRCSDGLDRHRQDWIEGACLERSATNVASCAHLPPFIHAAKPRVISKIARHLPGKEVKGSTGHAGGLIITLIILVLVAGVISWGSYAYYHPHTTSGQMLIKYRPSTWSWRGSGAKYTAATMHSIHM